MKKWGTVMCTPVIIAVDTDPLSELVVMHIYYQTAKLDRVGMGLLGLGLIVVLRWLVG
jgi:hypothetical protein